MIRQGPIVQSNVETLLIRKKGSQTQRPDESGWYLGKHPPSRPCIDIIGNYHPYPASRRGWHCNLQIEIGVKFQLGQCKTLWTPGPIIPNLYPKIYTFQQKMDGLMSLMSDSKWRIHLIHFCPPTVTAYPNFSLCFHMFPHCGWLKHDFSKFPCFNLRIGWRQHLPEMKWPNLGFGA